MTSTGSLNLSRAPRLRWSLLNVIWPVGWFNMILATKVKSYDTLSDSIVYLIHIQIIDIWGKDAIEHLCIYCGLLTGIASRDVSFTHDVQHFLAWV